MKRVSSVDRLSAQPALPVGVRNLRRHLASTSAAARATAVSWSSYIAISSAPQRLGCSVATIRRELSRHSLKVLNAVSLAGALSPSDDNLSVDLDWQPALNLTQEVVCWSCAAIACCVVYILTAPAGFSIPYATCIGLLFGMLLYSLRNSLMEEMYKARERIEADLGDPDSRFRHIDNLSVHVKVKAAKSLPPPAPSAAAARLAPPLAGAAGGPVAAVHCFHGFGSNTWSWSLVQQQLAERLGALVTAHDMPGFGLTQRPTDLSGYFLSFNGRLGRLAMDYELTVRGLLSHAEATKSGEAGYPHTSIHPAETSDRPAAVTAAIAAQDPTAAAAAAANEGESAAVQGVEESSGGSAGEAATAAVQQGLESPLQATAAAAAQGSITGVVKGAAAAAADAAAGNSSTSSSRKAASATAGKQQQQQQQRVKRVLMGHSLGGACAALEYIFNPSEYAAVILVDPAIIAGGFPSSSDRSSSSAPKLERLQDGTAFTRSLASGEYEQPEAAAAAAAHSKAAAAETGSSSGGSSSDFDALAAADSGSDGGAGLERSSSGAGSSGSSLNAAAAAGEVAFYATQGSEAHFSALLNPNQPKNLLSALLSRTLGLVQTLFMLSTVLVILALRPAIVLLLRTLVRSKNFWANTLKQAYYDQSKVTPAAVDAYRMPQLVRGWETGMVQFLMARLGAGGTSSSTSAAAAVGAAPMGGLEDQGLALRFAAAVAAHNTPVLVVHGAGDKLVPASNSLKLARLVKGCRVAVVNKAGHCPQEEEPALFSDIVASFLSRHVGV